MTCSHFLYTGVHASMPRNLIRETVPKENETFLGRMDPPPKERHSPVNRPVPSRGRSSCSSLKVRLTFLPAQLESPTSRHPILRIAPIVQEMLPSNSTGLAYTITMRALYPNSLISKTCHPFLTGCRYSFWCSLSSCIEPKAFCECLHLELSCRAI